MSHLVHPNREEQKVTQAGGAFGIATAIIAWYASAAVVINTTWGRTLLPIGLWVQPRKKLVRIAFLRPKALHPFAYLHIIVNDRATKMTFLFFS